MKKIFFLLLLGIWTQNSLLRAVPAESRRFTPYFNMKISQGGYLPSAGDFFTGANINANVGLLSKITERHALFALYDLDFSGQAFRFQDTREFASRELGHQFNFEHRWELCDFLKLRPGIAYGLNLTRTASNEIWGQGLYDSRSMGGQLALDYLFSLREKNATLTAQWIYRDIHFPNYTDIIREFQGLSANVELAGGLKDQTFNELSLALDYKPFFGSLRYSFIDFKNEKVVEPSGVYGNTPQKDTNLIFSLGLETKQWVFELVPQITYQQHSSNQNFLLFRSVTDASPIFAADYYDYKDLSFSAPLFVNLSERWALFGGLDYKRRMYSNRQARDGDNAFTGAIQTNNMTIISVGIRKKMNDISAMLLNYSTLVASSNNTFERYLPYNYSGQSISLAYQITY